MKLIIVGIDPGTTIGYAILDLEGNLIKTSSSKLLDLNSLISKIIKFGKPIITGTDVSKTPHFVQKFSIKTGSRLITPVEDLPVKEKLQLTKEFKTENIHEKDALAAALYAYKEITPLLNKINKFLKNNKKENIKQEVIELVIKKEEAISTAIKLVEHPERTKPKIIEKIIEKKIFSEDTLNLKEQLRKLKKDFSLLKDQNLKLKQKIQSFEKKPKKQEKTPPSLMKQRILQILEKENKKQKQLNKNLKKEIEELNSFIKELKDNILIKKAKDLGKNLTKVERGDILLIDDADIFSKENIKKIKDKVKVIIAKKVSNKNKFPFPIIESKNLDIKETKNFAVVDKVQLEKELNKQDLLKKVLEEYKQERS